MMRSLTFILLFTFASAQTCRDGEPCQESDRNVLLQRKVSVKVEQDEARSETERDEAADEEESVKPETVTVNQVKGLKPAAKKTAKAVVKAAVKAVDHGKKSSAELLKDMKRKSNGKGDLRAFLSALVVNVGGFCTMCAGFMMLHKRYPIMFSHNVLTGAAPRSIPDTTWGWLDCAWNVTPEEIEKTAGLDAAMLMEFVNMAMKVCFTIGVPMILILCPVHLFWGEDPDEDNLSKVGMGNIVAKHGGWAYFLHAFFVWFVVYITMKAIFEFQEKFIKKRYDWLMRMPCPRSTTVMVEGIPEKYCTDEGLRTCFERLFSPVDGGDSRIQCTYVVRKTASLEALVASYRNAEQSLAEANFQWQKDGATEETRPTVRRSVLGNTVDSIMYYEERKDEAGAAVIAERARLNDPANQSEVFTANGFVTFKTERDAKIALNMKIRADEEEFQLSVPPDPADIQYNDLYAHPAHLQVSAWVGYALIIALFFGFMPIVLGISSVTNLAALRQEIALVDNLVKAFPAAEIMLKGVLASLALTLFMGFLPTFLNLIFAFFFQLKAGRWSQHRLQIYYFWFQVIFVLLVTAVGSSLLATMKHLVNHPTMIFGLLADKLPCATHFYLNFMAMQWLVHGMNLTRYVQFMKFKAFSAICEEDRAKELAEPEDQDYYGMGARSARFTLNLVICLTYCSLSPLITVVTFVNFLVCKVVYGYLLVFAETPKSDLGGAFFVTSLVQVQKGLFIYISLMLGVLYYRAASHGPALIVLPCMLYMARQYSRFQSAYEWEIVPFEEFIEGQERKASWPKGTIREATRDSYAQPELTEPELDGQKKAEGYW